MTLFLLLLVSCAKNNDVKTVKLKYLNIIFIPSLFESSELSINFETNELFFYSLDNYNSTFEIGESNIQPNLSLENPISFVLNDVHLNKILDLLNSFKSTDFSDNTNNDLYDGMDIILYFRYDDNQVVKTLCKNTSTNNQVKLYELLFSIIQEENKVDKENIVYISRLGYSSN